MGRRCLSVQKERRSLNHSCRKEKPPCVHYKTSAKDRGQYTSAAVIERLGSLPEKSRMTLTLDNGTENAGQVKITEPTATKCYFARPYASWQRGTNENTNGLIRWYLPKGTDFSKITDEELTRIESLINQRLRKCLGYKTPLEVAASYGVALHG